MKTTLALLLVSLVASCSLAEAGDKLASAEIEYATYTCPSADGTRQVRERDIAFSTGLRSYHCEQD
jgi:hypothetical protein